MSDYASSLPVRTESAGDVIAKLADATTPSQQLAIDASGLVGAKVSDAAGNGLTSQASGGQRALDVGINVAGVQVDPRSIRALTSSDVVTADQGAPNTAANGWPVKPTDGTNSQSFTAAGEAKVEVTQPLPAGTNNIGSVNANLHDGAGVSVPLGQAVMASSLPVVIASNQSAVPVSVTELPSGGTVVDDYKKASAVAMNASDTHTYTVTSGKTLHLKRIVMSASGKFKAEIKYGTIGAEVSKEVYFNSAAEANCVHVYDYPIQLVDTKDILVIMTNLDKAAQDLYSTIHGYEV